MKKILSFVAVAAILTGAFAFAKPYGGAYCASQTQNFQCAVIADVTELPSGTALPAYYKYADWNGTSTDCLANRCATLTTFYVQP